MTGLQSMQSKSCFGFISIWKMLSPVITLSKTPSAALEQCPFLLGGKRPSVNSNSLGKIPGKVLFQPAEGQQLDSITKESSAIFNRADIHGQILPGVEFYPHARKSDVGGEILAGNFDLHIQLSFCAPTEE